MAAPSTAYTIGVVFQSDGTVTSVKNYFENNFINVVCCGPHLSLCPCIVHGMMGAELTVCHIENVKLCILADVH